jgi:hypothetical protein
MGTRDWYLMHYSNPSILTGGQKHTHTYSTSHTQHKSNASQDLQPAHEQDSMDTDDRSKVVQSLALSQPLARRSLWPATKTQQRY